MRGRAIKSSAGIWFGGLSGLAIIIAAAIAIGAYQNQVSENTRRITVLEEQYQVYLSNMGNRIKELRSLESRVNAIEAVEAAKREK